MVDAPVLVLLPGMDGTGRLFAPLLEVLAGRYETRVLSLPGDRAVGAEELVDRVRAICPADRAFVLVAESFCGPSAVRLAARRPPGLRGLVLVASFVTSPVRRWHRPLLGLAPLLFRLPPPCFVLRALIGRGAPAQLVAELRGALREVQARVLAGRLRQLLDVDEREALARIRVPILQLVAGRDRLVGRDVTAALTAAGAGVACRVVDGPHLLLQREPAACWAVVESWLGQSARSP